MRIITASLILLAAAVAVPAGALAEVQTKVVEYRSGDVPLTGHLYWDDSIAGKRPGVLVIHEWWGLNDYAKSRARMLAELGYVAFAADMYGNDQVTDQPEQAQSWMQEVTEDVALWVERAELGLAQLKASEWVDPTRTAAIGYCFGGGTVLQMAYADNDVLGVVSFHGSLPAAPEWAEGEIGPKLLVLHGEADTFVAPEVVANFKTRLEAAGANWEMVTYGGVRHSFTNPNVGAYGIENLKYDAQADARSWARMQSFFDELFGN